jgi:hypothetical protein
MDDVEVRSGVKIWLRGWLSVVAASRLRFSVVWLFGFGTGDVALGDKVNTHAANLK